MNTDKNTATVNPINDNQKKLAELSRMVEKYCLENNISAYMAAAIECRNSQGDIENDSVTYCNGTVGAISRSIVLSMKHNKQVESLFTGLMFKTLVEGKNTVVIGVDPSKMGN